MLVREVTCACLVSLCPHCASASDWGVCVGLSYLWRGVFVSSAVSVPPPLVRPSVSRGVSFRHTMDIVV